METIATLHQLLDYDAANFTCAEVHLEKALTKWLANADSLQLKLILEKYLHQVSEHVQRMESFFTSEKFTAMSVQNRIMQAYIDETTEKLSYCADAEIKDACLLACIQGINHFKISSYGTASAFAGSLGLDEAALLFRTMEINEKQIDDRLSQLAEFEINKKARAPISIAKT